MIIETAVGPANVLHRLALAVECVDALTDRPSIPAVSGIRVGREVDSRRLPRDADPWWPCLDFDATGAGYRTLRREPGLPDIVTVRIEDPNRYVVPRRLRVPLWTVTDVEAADRTPPTGRYVPARSRLLRPWLLPGSARPLPRSATAIRGRVERNGAVVRWPRITAFGPGGVAVGWAHGDDRGEFLLIVTGTGTLPPPAPNRLNLELAVSAPDPRRPIPAFDPADRYGDLVVEEVPRSAAPPTLTDLDNPLLRGRARPPGYVDSTGPKLHLRVGVGNLRTLHTPIAFAA